MRREDCGLVLTKICIYIWKNNLFLLFFDKILPPPDIAGGRFDRMPSRGPVRRTVRSSVGYCVTAQYGKAATRAGAALPLCVTGGVCRPQRLVRMLQQQGAQPGDRPGDLPGPRRTTGSLRRWLTVAERAARGSSRRSARPPPHDGLSSQVAYSSRACSPGIVPAICPAPAARRALFAGGLQ